ncbi:MAG: selenide, water dikinase SelD [Campylobacterales bacterium]|nr:selenide, water dikinase SelD [Campylobacterales bacterium]
MGPADLTQLFGSFSQDKNDSVLVGFDTSDDAGVYKINDDFAMVQTLDLITPVVDDPYTFGQIAAANSLSDVFAMGGEPLTALNIVCFDNVNLNLEILREILDGGNQKIKEAGCALIGGHTVEDVQMKYGLSVTGRINPNRILKNNAAKEGELLISVKAFGIGVLTTAMKAQMAGSGQSKKAIDTMLKLNDKASKIALKYNASACTDITGFGLMGHLSEMAKNITMIIDSSKVPLLDGAMEYAKMGLVCGGSHKNRKFLQPILSYDNIDEDLMMILFDAQTSGGLVFSLDEKNAKDALSQLIDNGYEDAAIIGQCVQKEDVSVKVV